MNDQEELNRIHGLIDTDYFAIDLQRDAANEDIRFVDVEGGMYDGWLEDQFLERPKMEFNKLSQAIHRFIGEWQTNRFQTKFIPDDGKTSEEDAELLTGLFRKDFNRSSGTEAVDNAVLEMCKGGYGAFRLSTEFVDESDIDNDDQQVIFEPIFSAHNSVIFDANAKKTDKSDARHVTYLEEMDDAAAREEYGEDVASAFNPSQYNYRFNWGNNSKIWIAHFYEIKEEKDTVIVYEDPLGRRKAVYEKDFKQYVDELADGGFEEVSKRKKIRRTVWKTVLGGAQILEKPVRIPGQLLPIVPMFGYRAYVDGNEWFYGLVRKQKDAQRMFNMAASSIAEQQATTSKDMPIFTDEQVEGRENQLAEMHLGQYNYAVINQLYDESGNLIPAGPVGTWAAPRVDPNSAAVLTMAGEFIREETGGSPQDVIDPKTSGKAINAAVSRVDMNSQPLMEGIAYALKQCGKVYESIASEIHDVEKVVNVIKQDGSETTAMLFELVTDEKTGQTKAVNDIGAAKFSVFVDVGANFASKRRETVESMKDVLMSIDQTNPYYGHVFAELIENMDGVGLSGLKKFNRKFQIMNGMAEPETDEEMQMVQQAQANQQNEQQEYLMALAAESNANAQESMSNVQKNASVTQLNNAKTAETLAGIELDRFKAVNDAQSERVSDIQAQVPRFKYNPQSGQLDRVG